MEKDPVDNVLEQTFKPYDPHFPNKFTEPPKVCAIKPYCPDGDHTFTPAAEKEQRKQNAATGTSSVPVFVTNTKLPHGSFVHANLYATE